MLEDKKTYICAALAGLATIAYSLGWIEQSTWQVIMGLLVPAAAATLKAGQLAQTAKIEAKAAEVAKTLAKTTAPCDCPPRV